MTTHEMVYDLQQRAEVVSNQFMIKERPTTDIWLSYLNKSQLKVFSDKYLNKGSFKETSDFLKNIAGSELAKLIQTTNAITISSVTFEGHNNNSAKSYRYATALSQYAHYIDSYSYMARTLPKVVTAAWVVNEEADSMEDLRKVETNWYNKPILKNPIVFLDGSANLSTASQPIYIYLITDSYTTLEASSNFNMRYIRRPKSLNFTITSATVDTTESELAEHVHMTIVDTAFEMFKSEKFLLTSK